MLLIDVFNKLMHAVPVRGKKEEDLAIGTIERESNQKSYIYVYIYIQTTMEQ